jgi:hypothetical protein
MATKNKKNVASMTANSKIALNDFKAVLAHALLQTEIIGKSKAEKTGVQSTAEIISKAIQDGENKFSADVVAKVEEVITKGMTFVPNSTKPGDNFQENVRNAFLNCFRTEKVNPDQLSLLVWLPKVIKDSETPRVEKTVEGRIVTPGTYSLNLILIEQKDINGQFGAQTVHTFKAVDGLHKGDFFELWTKQGSIDLQIGETYSTTTKVNMNRFGTVMPKPFNGRVANKLAGRTKLV